MRFKTALAALAVIAVMATVVVAQPVQAAQGDHILLDHGNGITEWAEASPGSVYSRVIVDSFGDSEFDFTSGIEVDGLSERTVGTVESSWRFYVWDDGWVDSVFDPSATYSGGSFALGFYPEGVVPTETPEYRSSWTMVNGDALSTNSQTTDLSTEPGHLVWAETYDVGESESYVCSNILVAGKHALINSGGSYNNQVPPTLHCVDRFTGQEIWAFEYPRGAGYETATGTIVNGFIYFPTSAGGLYRIPVEEGPGVNNANVTSVDIPRSPASPVQGTPYATGAASIVHDSGVIYFGASDANMYCFDLDLNPIWKTGLESRVYFIAPTVHDGRVYMGSLDGTLAVLDQTDGSIIQEERVFYITIHYSTYDRECGSVNRVAVMGDLIYFSFDDGLGMSSTEGGIACYRITDSGISEVFTDESLGKINDYVTPYEYDGFSGVLFADDDGMYRVDSTGTVTKMADVDDSTRSPYVIVNDRYIYFAEYKRGGNIYVTDMEGRILGYTTQPGNIAQFSMSGITIVDGMFLVGTDGGAMIYDGTMPPMPMAEPGSDLPWGYVVLAIVVLILLIGLVMLFKGSRDAGMPLIPYISNKLKENSGFNNDRTSKVKRNKRRLATVIVIGLVIGLILFVSTLAYGPSGNYSFTDAVAILFSAIGKNLTGAEMTYDEIIIFESRCSRAVAAFFVGLGLSVSGAIYQAIIRNPMVDPYIMGVSAGAGVAAIAVIAFDFTFFGLLTNSVYTTPVVAIIGGVIAFFATMLLAEKAGGSSINYVLGGVIIGLVFSAAQTLMLSVAGDKLNDAMSWLFGSFASISWEQAILVAIPAFALSLVPLIWAKEFNLVLLGEDQAKQMGLDVRRFNRYMLILASVLASICVAFVGIIGFVGLVVPHLCRMILGGDHRLVLPASMVVGGALMLAADLFSKMIMAPMELPVGAITTIIGAPVFAYLLIKKGRMYDG